MSTVAFQFSVSRFVGQARAIEWLAGALRAGHSPTSILFSGPPLVGKTTLALIFARALMCRNHAPDMGIAACGDCNSCRAIEAGQFSDFTFVLPRTKKITVEIIREEYDDFAAALRHPSESRHRVILIDYAHTLNEQTGNMMLKLFEEAPDKTVFILVSDHPYDLIETIRSRCEEVRLSGEPPEFIEETLIERGVEPGVAGRSAVFSQGKWVLANYLANSPELLGAVERIAKVLSTARRGVAAIEDVEEAIEKATDILDLILGGSEDKDGKGREADVVRWTLADPELLGATTKKELERWDVTPVRKQEIRRTAQKTVFDWIRGEIVKRAPRPAQGRGRRSHVLSQIAHLDRAELWLEQNVREEYILKALAMNL